VCVFSLSLSLSEASISELGLSDLLVVSLLSEGDGEERISDTKGHSQQNQGEGAAEAAMVLPDVSEAVS
jgi:hypothetical protein